MSEFFPPKPGGHMSPESLQQKLDSLKPGETFVYEGVVYKRSKATGKIVTEPVIEHDNGNPINHKPL